MQAISWKRTVRTRLLFAILIASTCPAQAPGQIVDMVKETGVAVLKAGASALAIYIVEKEVADPIYDKVTGQMSKAEADRHIALLIKRDQEHEADYLEMQSQLRDKMSRQEVEAIMMKTLRKINPTLAEHTKQIRDLQDARETHRYLIERLSRDQEMMASLQSTNAAQIQAQATIAARLDSEFEQLRKEYPRYKPGQQAQMLGTSGMKFLRENDNKEAMRAFRFAHAFDTKEAGFLYGLAVAYRRDGQHAEAEILLARGVAAERHRPVAYSDWWNNSIERFQGPDRRWLNNARRDPIYGVHVRGLMYVPEVAAPKKQN